MHQASDPVVSSFTNENGNDIRLSVSMINGQMMDFVVIEGESFKSSIHHMWTMREAQELRKLLNMALPNV